MSLNLSLTDIEQQQMAELYEALMADRGVIYRWSPTTEYDETNADVPAWTPDPDSTKLGFKATSREVVVFGEIKQVVGQVRLPKSTVLDTRDRILLLSRYGVVLETPVWLEVAGVPIPGPTGLYLQVSEVTDSGAPG